LGKKAEKSSGSKNSDPNADEREDAGVFAQWSICKVGRDVFLDSN